MAKKPIKETIHAKGLDISIYTNDFENEYVSLTDIAKYRSTDPRITIHNWLRSRDIVVFLGLWESLHNPNFKRIDFDTFKEDAGSNAYVFSIKKWNEELGGIGILTKSGRYGGGIYAHMDIALEFASWISPEFKLYIIKDYKRLKSDESSHLSLNWNLNREIARLNYRIHTDAIKEKIGCAVDTTDLEKQLKALRNQLRQAEGTKNRLEQQMDTLDITDVHYDRKILDLQRRYDDQYDRISTLEKQIDEVETQIRSIRQEQISGENVYQLLLTFDQLYAELTEPEKKEFMRAILERIDLYPAKRPDGCWIRNILFSFPVPIGGKAIRELSLENSSILETVVKSIHFDGMNEVKLFFTWMLAAFLNVIMQELLVRGYLYQILKQKNNIVAAIFYNGILYSMSWRSI